MLEKSFINKQLVVKLKSFIDDKFNIWFKGKQVSTILGYKNTDDAIKRHVSENLKRKLLLSCPRESRGQVQGRWIIFIDEAGFYELVFRSKLETAKKFRDWVFSKVLPSIRKYGYYKLFDTIEKQRVSFGEKKYYKLPVFSRYAASKNGEILSLKTNRIICMTKNNRGYFKFKICDKNLKKSLHIFNIDLFMKYLKDQFQDV